MKRALAIAAALCTIGVGAFGLGTITGKWEGNLTLLQTPSLTQNSLTLNYTEYGLTFGAILSLLGVGEDTVQLTLGGAFGPLELKGNMYFDFDAAKYQASKLSTGLDFAGLAIGVNIWHWAPGAYRVLDPYYTEYYPDPCQTTDGAGKPVYDYGAGMLYILKATVAPLSIQVNFLDCCTGVEFDKLVATLEGLGLCCGISLDAEFAFTKLNGFSYLELSGIEIPLCCGVSLTPGVTFTTKGKEVDVGFDFAGFGEACFTVYADAVAQTNAWTGIDIYGWKISCTIADCNTIEFVTATDVTAVEGILGDVFVKDEFEYVKMTFCGAGCCGQQWKAGLAIYFGDGTDPETDTGLFGISRLGFDLALPLNDALKVTVAFSAPTTALTLGWVFTF